MSVEHKVSYLEFLRDFSDPLAEIISLASVKSEGELQVIAEYGREMLADVAREGLSVVKGQYGSLPKIGQTPEDIASDLFEEIDDSFVRIHEGELEINLALFYTALIHCQKTPQLYGERDRLVASANQKLSGSHLGRQRFLQRSVMRYMDAASWVLGGDIKREEVTEHLKVTRNLFFELPEEYNHRDTYLSSFNLGRIFFLMKNNCMARSVLKNVSVMAFWNDNYLHHQLAEYYLAALDDNKCNGIIDDPPLLKAKLGELADQISKPRVQVMGLKPGMVLW